MSFDTRLDLPKSPTVVNHRQRPCARHRWLRDGSCSRLYSQTKMLVYLTQHPEAFDPETITILAEALDSTWATIKASGAQFDGRDENARDAVAKYIVELALRGERDRQRLIDSALLRFKL
jgi:hypothetical protein